MFQTVVQNGKSGEYGETFSENETGTYTKCIKQTGKIWQQCEWPILLRWDKMSSNMGVHARKDR
jgi:hypothetical protein